MRPRGRFLIDLPIGEDWKLVEQLRTGIIGCLGAAFPDPDVRDLAAMVVSELLENALKYGDWTGTPDGPAACRLEVEGGPEVLKVVVSHPARRGKSLDRLFAALASIEHAPNAEEAYLERMRELAQGREGPGGLGLRRIAHEARCALSAQLNPEGVLTVTALSNLPAIS
jgi:hypothetical protein